jgi:hypothetical protein
MRTIHVEQKPIPPHIQEQIARNLRTGRELAQQTDRLDRRLEWIEKGWTVLISGALILIGFLALCLGAVLIPIVVAWWVS